MDVLQKNVTTTEAACGILDIQYCNGPGDGGDNDEDNDDDPTIPWVRLGLNSSCSFIKISIATLSVVRVVAIGQ